MTIKAQLLGGFEHLTAQDVEEGFSKVAGRLIKIGKAKTRKDAEEYINETLTILLDERQREKFDAAFDKKDSEAVCRRSIYIFFANLDHKNRYKLSGTEAAVHGARGILGTMQRNSVIKL